MVNPTSVQDEIKKLTKKVGLITLEVAILASCIIGLFIKDANAAVGDILYEQPVSDLAITRNYQFQSFTPDANWVVGGVKADWLRSVDTTFYICEGEPTEANVEEFYSACVSDHLAQGVFWGRENYNYTVASLAGSVVLEQGVDYTIAMEYMQYPVAIIFGAKNGLDGRWLGCNSNNFECTKADLRFAIVEGEAIDNREDPAALVMTPASAAAVEQQIFNGVGADAYYLRLASNVSSVDFPGENDATVDVEIYDNSQTTLICQIVGATANDSNVDGQYNYGATPSWLVEGVKADGVTPCANFAVSAENENYYIRARWQFGGFTSGQWSALQPFRVVPFGYVPPVTCPENASFISDFPCWSENAIAFLFSPSDTYVNALFDAVTSFSDRWPISWFTDSTYALRDAFSVSTTTLAAAHSGNPLVGDYPNASWYVEKLKALYGDWASGATAAFIWVGAMVAVTRGGKALLNIDDDDGTETG